MSDMFSTTLFARASVRFALPLGAALMLSACAQTGMEAGVQQLGQNAAVSGEVWATETVKGEALPAPQPGPAQPLTSAGDTSTNLETVAAIRDARKVRQGGNKARALGILEKTPGSDTDKALLLERGLMTLEIGQIDKAVELLKAAHDPMAPDWRQHSGLGAALSSQDHQAEAQEEFNKALKLSPNNPSILNNLALSYALDGKHAEAERLLRNVSDKEDSAPQTKQNLALILGLRGNIDEARKVSEAVLPPEKVKSNVAYLEGLNAPPEQVSRANETDLEDLVRSASTAVPDRKPDRPVSELGLANSN